jgi:antitoxin HicB
MKSAVVRPFINEHFLAYRNAADAELEEARAIAIKDAVAWQVQQAMLKDKVTKVEMARRMYTSRAALDPGNGAVTLQTLSRAANAVGRELRIELL